MTFEIEEMDHDKELERLMKNKTIIETILEDIKHSSKTKPQPHRNYEREIEDYEHKLKETVELIDYHKSRVK